MTLSGLALGFGKGWTLAFAMLGITPFQMVGMAILGGTIGAKVKKQIMAYGQSAGYAEQALSAIKVVVAFGQEQVERTNYTQFLSSARDIGRKASISAGLGMGFFNWCMFAAYAYAFTIGGHWVDKEYWNHAAQRAYSPGDCISVFFTILFGFFTLSSAAPQFAAIIEGRAAARLAFDIINRDPAIDQDANKNNPHKIQGKISFRGVSFFYPTRVDQMILKNLNIEFEMGKTTAIVGPSGSGKSTVVQLVERFYDPTEGEVLIDDKPLKGVHLRDYRRQIGYVSQEPTLFNTSIRENLRICKPDATEQEMIEALKSTNAYDVVMEMGGLDAMAGASGSKLSGGEKQRIALARAFIKKPKLLIFDEATSALDKKNEAEV